LRRFTGEYDLLGNQVLTKGQTSRDSINRFKGQQSPAIIIADAEQGKRSDDEFKRLLYTAMSRATLKLCIVVPRESALTAQMREASYA